VETKAFVESIADSSDDLSIIRDDVRLICKACKDDGQDICANLRTIRHLATWLVILATTVVVGVSVLTICLLHSTT
jgi:hypothetical protein